MMMTCDLFGKTVGVKRSLVRGYWFTDCGQRCGLYIASGRYRVTDRTRKIEGTEALYLEQLFDPAGGYWVPTEVVAKLPAA